MKKKEAQVFDFSLTLTPSQEEKIEHLKSFFKPYTKRVYIVGGFLRDEVLGIFTHDIDIEVYGVCKKEFNALMKKLGANVLSEKFHVYDYEGIDIALPRTEIKTSSGYHGFSIEVTNDEKEGTLRRDFTINALMYNLYDNKLYDFWGGMDDIRNKKLKIVNPETFKDDSLRLVRGVRLMAQFGLSVDEDSKKILNEMDLSELTKTRVNKELQKLFK